MKNIEIDLIALLMFSIWIIIKLGWVLATIGLIFLAIYLDDLIKLMT